MSSQMNRLSLVVAAASVILFSAGRPGAFAQSITATGAVDQSLYFDLDFPGGTLEQYVQAIRKAHGSANVMLSDGAKKARIPAVMFNGVTLDAAMSVLRGRSLSRDDGSFGIQPDPVRLAGRDEMAYRVSLYPWEFPADRLKKKQGSKKADQPAAEAQSHVWSLRDLIDAGLKMDDVLGAVDAALKTIDKPFKIRLHDPTALLIVRGSDEQLNLVDQTVSAMRTDVSERAESALSNADEIDALQGELVKAEVKMRVAAKKLEIASEYVRHDQQNFEKQRPDLTDDQVAGSQSWIRGLELEAIKAEGEVQIAKDKVERLLKRLDRLGGGRSEPAKLE